MVKRTVTAFALLALGMPAILLGGIPYLLFIGFFVVMSAYEYTQLFRAIGHQPSIWGTVGGTALILAARSQFPEWAGAVFAFTILAAMTRHLLAYERGREQAAIDFVITAGGLAYLGWVGGYLIDIRALPNGGWWMFLVLPTVWMADTGAYVIGARYGKHKMTPRLSPKKSWEGYWAGVFTGTLFGGFFAWAYNVNTFVGPLTISIWQGALLGFVLSVLTTLGDLGESLFKRPAHVKDSGNVVPGHGGAFDRIDTSLWGAVIGYYWIVWFLL